MDYQYAEIANQASSDITGFFMIWLLLGLVFGLITTCMAASRDRNRLAGFVGGLLFGILSVFYYLIVGDSTELRIKKEEEARRKYRAELKEQDDDKL